MRRWHEEAVISRRHWRIHQKLVHDDLPTGCVCDEQVGRFRKYHGRGCRKSRCQLCQFDKIHAIKSHRERMADLRFCEQIVNHD